MKKRINLLVPAGSLAAMIAALLFAGCKKEEAPATPPAAQATTNAVPTASVLPAGVVPYPLSNCVVSGEKLGGDMGTPVEFVYQNQEIKFCCSMCQPKFLKDPDTYMKKIKEAQTSAKN